MRTLSAVPTTQSCVQVGLCGERHLSIQDSQLCSMVPTIERFHCIQDSQLGPNCVLYREVPLSIAKEHNNPCIPAARSVEWIRIS